MSAHPLATSCLGRRSPLLYTGGDVRLSNIVLLETGIFACSFLTHIQTCKVSGNLFLNGTIFSELAWELQPRKDLRALEWERVRLFTFWGLAPLVMRAVRESFQYNGDVAPVVACSRFGV